MERTQESFAHGYNKATLRVISDIEKANDEHWEKVYEVIEQRKELQKLDEMRLNENRP